MANEVSGRSREDEVEKGGGEAEGRSTNRRKIESRQSRDSSWSGWRRSPRASALHVRAHRGSRSIARADSGGGSRAEGGLRRLAGRPDRPRPPRPSRDALGVSTARPAVRSRAIRASRRREQKPSRSLPRQPPPPRRGGSPCPAVGKRELAVGCRGSGARNNAQLVCCTPRRRARVQPAGLSVRARPPQSHDSPRPLAAAVLSRGLRVRSRTQGCSCRCLRARGPMAGTPRRTGGRRLAPSE